MIFHYSLSDEVWVRLIINKPIKRADLEFFRVCILRAVDQVKEEVMQRVVIEQMIEESQRPVIEPQKQPEAGSESENEGE
jgi:hypothetical protein